MINHSKLSFSEVASGFGVRQRSDAMSLFTLREVDEEKKYQKAKKD